ncbi:MAG: DTW domain-containing protein [Spirochaetia bacterium]|nr:DTW domain-containing protein [Spirochaetia bacterium]
MCDRLTKVPNKLQIVVLQHPAERRNVLETAPLITASLSAATVKVGLSWASLKDAAGPGAKPDSWAVVFPKNYGLHAAPEAPPKGAETLVMDKTGDPFSKPPRLEGVLLLDGSWSQARTMWWRNAWLLKLLRIRLFPKNPSIYGRLRKEPEKDSLSTLEAAALVLRDLDHNPEACDVLLRTLRTFVQRVRDFDSSL